VDSTDLQVNFQLNSPGVWREARTPEDPQDQDRELDARGARRCALFIFTEPADRRQLVPYFPLPKQKP